MFLDSIKKLGFTDVLLILTFVFVGGFHEYVCCAISVALCAYLIIRLTKSRCFYIKKELLSVSVIVLCLFYGVTCLWAIDRGMAFIGFLKFLPVALYLLCLWQEQKDSALLELLPYFVAIVAVIYTILMLLGIGKGTVSVAGRLAGPFQYPNTFSLLILVCELLLLKKDKKTVFDFVTIAILIGALLYTGSRSVFVVFVLANIAMLFTSKQKKLKTALIIILGALILVSVILLFNENSILRRYLNISLTESTFVGRILYYVDALALILRYPFGMGYMGYFFTQTEIQSGVYSVMFIHNDFLQFILDVGIIPAAFFVFAVIRWFFKKGATASDKIIAAAVCLHSLLDFNLQYIFMFMLLLVLMGAANKDNLIEIKFTSAYKTAFALTLVCALYMMLPLSLSHYNKRELADTLYPFNTQNKLHMLERETSLDRAYKLSEEIIAQNTHHFAPYSIRAKYSYSKGDFTSLIENKQKVFELSPFAHKEYEEYFTMLINGIALYEKSGMQSSADFCKQEILRTEKQFYANKDRLSKLGKMIDDQPVLELPDNIKKYIAGLKGE